MSLPTPGARRVSVPITGVSWALHLSYYHPPRNGYQERVSKALLEFKAGREIQVGKWVSCASSALAGTIVCDVIIRVLGSGELRAATDNPLDALGMGLSRHLGAPYAPGRLTKTRVTKPLHGRGGKESRKKELEGAFTFDAEGLREGCRVLVIDELMTSGATMETVAAEIHRALPSAEVLCFVLGKSDSIAQNSHLNPAFFSSPSLNSPWAAEQSAPRSTPSPSRRASRSSRRMLQLVAAGLTVIVLGAMVQLKAGRSAMESKTLPQAIPLPDSMQNASLYQGYDSLNSKAEEVQLHVGVVTVPSAGLRRKHDLDANPLPKCGVRSGERVEIVNKFISPSGPNWVLIRTRTGVVGWLPASVVSDKGMRTSL